MNDSLLLPMDFNIQEEPNRDVCFHTQFWYDNPGFFNRLFGEKRVTHSFYTDWHEEMPQGMKSSFLRYLVAVNPGFSPEDITHSRYYVQGDLKYGSEVRIYHKTDLLINKRFTRSRLYVPGAVIEIPRKGRLKLKARIPQDIMQDQNPDLVKKNRDICINATKKIDEWVGAMRNASISDDLFLGFEDVPYCEWETEPDLLVMEEFGRCRKWLSVVESLVPGFDEALADARLEKEKEQDADERTAKYPLGPRWDLKAV